MIKKSVIIEKKNAKPILADVTFEGDNMKKPFVLFCHGYKGFKDWGAWGLVAETFAKNNFVFVKFNFSHNGGTISEPIDFPDEKAFGENTYSLEIEDTKRMIDFISKRHPDQDIYLIGHSRGGGVASLVAGQDSRVKKVSTWAAVSDFKVRFPKGEHLEQWKEKGVYFIKNGRTKQDLPHNYSFYTDFIENETNLTIKNWVEKITVPHLIVHGENDEAVSVEEARSLHKWNNKSELYLLDANHTFGGKHPWIENYLPKELEQITQKTIEFFT